MTKKTKQNLTDVQVKAIRDTYRAIDSSLDMLLDCQDMYLSDVRELERVRWKLMSEFKFLTEKD
jgi:hypothetical protein